MRFLCLVLLLLPASAREFPGARGENIQGAVLTAGPHPALITWGDRLVRWSLPGGAKKVLATPDAPFSQGGCATEDGTGLFLQEGKSPGKLVLRQAPTWDSRTIDTGIDMPNCLAVTLLGRKGVLMVNRGMQMRFYEYPDFHYREIYSFYSPSRQAGLLIADVDQDGRPDILCGNYWIRSPAQFDLPWRLFAIFPYNTGPFTATLQLLLDAGGKSEIVSQGELSTGLLTRFTKPEDPRKLWTEQRIAELHHPRVLIRTANGILVAEDNGPNSRVYRLTANRLAEIGRTHGVLAGFAFGDHVVLIGRNEIYLRK